MRVLIDECLDWRLTRGLPGHTVNSVQRMGWAGVKNGRLLALAEEQFDVFVTGDRNLSFQQAIGQLHLAIVVLAAESTRLKDTLPLMPRLLVLLPQLQPGTITVLTP
jgi:predicted nuclease of predicted toxin-antitoxin system